jgi:hypothetical protein
MRLGDSGGRAIFAEYGIRRIGFDLPKAFC